MSPKSSSPASRILLFGGSFIGLTGFTGLEGGSGSTLFTFSVVTGAAMASPSLLAGTASVTSEMIFSLRVVLAKEAAVSVVDTSTDTLSACSVVVRALSSLASCIVLDDNDVDESASEEEVSIKETLAVTLIDGKGVKLGDFVEGAAVMMFDLDVVDVDDVVDVVVVVVVVVAGAAIGSSGFGLTSTDADGFCSMLFVSVISVSPNSLALIASGNLQQLPK